MPGHNRYNRDYLLLRLVNPVKIFLADDYIAIQADNQTLPTGFRRNHNGLISELTLFDFLLQQGRDELHKSEDSLERASKDASTP